MAYQNIGTPRFYIDIPSYLSSIGAEYDAKLISGTFTDNLKEEGRNDRMNKVNNAATHIPIVFERLN